MHSRRLITSSVVFIDGQNDLKTIQYIVRRAFYFLTAHARRKNEGPVER